MLLIDDLTAGCLQLVRLSIHDSVFRGHASISDQTLSGRGGGHPADSRGYQPLVRNPGLVKKDRSKPINERFRLPGGEGRASLSPAKKA